MILRGLVLLCPITPPSYGGILSLDGGVEGTKVWSYEVWCCCAPFAVFSRSDGGGEGMVLRGLVRLCLLPPS